MELDEDKRNGMAQRREHARLLLSLPAALYSVEEMKSMPTRLLDISRTGAGLVHSTQLSARSQYALRFELPGEIDQCEVLLEIVYSVQIGETSQYRCGARFHHLTSKVEDQLVDFLTRPKPK